MSKYTLSEQEFLQYFRDFYGPKGMYPNSIPEYTDQQVIAGIACRGGNFEDYKVNRL